MLYLLQFVSLLQIDLSQAVLAKLAHNYQRESGCEPLPQQVTYALPAGDHFSSQ